MLAAYVSLIASPVVAEYINTVSVVVASAQHLATTTGPFHRRTSFASYGVIFVWILCD